MSSIEQQKTINHGGKQSGKIEGGISFVQNTNPASVTVLTAPAGTYVAVGNIAGATQSSFSLTNSSLSDPYEYFEIFNSGTPVLPQSIAQFQRLRYRKGREATRLVLSWGLTIKDASLVDPPADGFLVGFRITRRDGLGAVSTITSTQITAAVFGYDTRIIHHTLVDINPLDSFAIELANIDPVANARNAVITSAEISLTE